MGASIGNDLVQIGESNGSGDINVALANSLEVANVDGNEDRDSIDKTEDQIDNAFQNRGWLMY